MTTDPSPARPVPLRVWVPAVPNVDVADRAERLGLAPILRAAVDARHDDDGRARRYGSLLTSYFLVDDPGEAEVALLPALVEATPRPDLAQTIERAEAHRLRTLVFSGDDLEPVLPWASAILLHPGPTRGAQPGADVLAVPYLFTDRGGPEPTRPDAERPSVAFCGQGESRPASAIGHLGRRMVGRAANARRPRVVSPPVRGHVHLRATALRRLADDPRVDHRFVIRDRYRAGAADEATRARTQEEFDANLRSSTYALCVRGTGNFSARFYEALSLGRVPLLVDTGGSLPLEDVIDWSGRVVLVPRRSVRGLADHLVDAHPSVLADPDRSPAALRSLWEDHLTQDGFFRHLPDRVRRLI